MQDLGNLGAHTKMEGRPVSNSVSWLLDFAIKDGQRENFDAMLKDMVESAQSNEPNTLNFEAFINPDGKNGQLYERYRDSAATMIHLGTFGEKFVDRFLAVLDPVRFLIYGTPNGEVKVALEPFGPVYMDDLAVSPARGTSEAGEPGRFDHAGQSCSSSQDARVALTAQRSPPEISMGRFDRTDAAPEDRSRGARWDAPRLLDSVK